MAPELSKLLTPKSVAIIGVSESPTRIGGRLFKYLTKHGYKGELALVNPKYKELNNVKCYPAISDVPMDIDCALVAVPGKFVFPVLNECADNNVGSVVIFSSGFAEMGIEGKKAQDKLKELARTKNIRICGPNCIGLVNFNDNIALSFSQFMETESLIPGNIGFISQSGALGGSMANRAQDNSIGLSYFISSGNEADLDVSDYIRHLVLHDDRTKVIAAVIEGFKDGEKFIKVAELALKHRKPIIVLKIGETEVGKKAAASHTGSMTGSDSVIDAILKQKGVIRVSNYDELFQTASLFSKNRIPEGNRIGILSSSGGAGIIMADHYTKLGLTVPEPSKKTIEIASKEMASFGQVANPFDLTGQIFSDPEMFKRCFNYFIDDENFDIIQINMSMVAGQGSVNRALQLLEVAKDSKKPVVAWWAAGSLSNPGIQILNNSEVASFKSPDRCAAAVKALVNYHMAAKKSAKEEPANTNNDMPDLSIDKNKVKKILDASDKSLSEHESKALLNLYGIPVTREKIVNCVDDAVNFAEQVGFPVVLKIDSPDILHKTEADVIRLRINSPKDIARSYKEIIDNAFLYDPSAKINGVAVQEMVIGGTEVIAGMSQDPQFGPIIAFGLGGIFVEVLKDISLRITPLSKSEAKNMVRQIKGFPILNGIRGKAPSDIKAVENLLLRLSRLACDWKDYIAEIDINPLIVLDDGQGVKALDALVILKEK
ncbi:MAG: acetate--CoA ligase family protein [Desulfobacula sp.]|nr:acetate--CoA ligase family protein [Desulfobacula sp.]